jgi:hypothetical protein
MYKKVPCLFKKVILIMAPSFFVKQYLKMIKIVEILFFCSLACTLFSLIFGLTVYFKGGALNEKYGNQAMRWRLTFQATTLMLFLLMLWLKS